MSGLGSILGAIRELISLDVKVGGIERDVEEVRRDAQEIKHLLAEYLRLVDRISTRQERLEEIVGKLEEDLSERVLARIQTKMVAVQSEIDLVKERFRHGFPGSNSYIVEGAVDEKLAE
jgi:chromosome segregation ATPase